MIALERRCGKPFLCGDFSTWITDSDCWTRSSTGQGWLSEGLGPLLGRAQSGASI